MHWARRKLLTLHFHIVTNFAKILSGKPFNNFIFSYLLPVLFVIEHNICLFPNSLSKTNFLPMFAIFWHQEPCFWLKHRVKQRVVNNLQRARLSCGRMIRLLAHPLPLISRQQIVSLSQYSPVRPYWRWEGEGCRHGGKLYDHEKAWPSINHSILSGVTWQLLYFQRPCWLVAFSTDGPRTRTITSWRRSVSSRWASMQIKRKFCIS